MYYSINQLESLSSKLTVDIPKKYSDINLLMEILLIYMQIHHFPINGDVDYCSERWDFKIFCYGLMTEI